MILRGNYFCALNKFSLDMVGVYYICLYLPLTPPPPPPFFVAFHFLLFLFFYKKNLPT